MDWLGLRARAAGSGWRLWVYNLEADTPYEIESYLNLGTGWGYHGSVSITIAGDTSNALTPTEAFRFYRVIRSY